jgi:hypothetical protein
MHGENKKNHGHLRRMPAADKESSDIPIGHYRSLDHRTIWAVLSSPRTILCAVSCAPRSAPRAENDFVEQCISAAATKREDDAVCRECLDIGRNRPYPCPHASSSLIRRHYT